MGLFNRRESASAPQPPALVAAAEPVNIANFQETQALSLTRMPWQNRAWGYYDEIGEIHFAARYIGNALAKIRLVAAERANSQTDAPRETKNKAVKEAIGNLRSPMGGQSGLMRSMGLNLFIAGEGFLLGRTVDGVQVWEFASINELIIQPGIRQPLRRRNPVETPKPVDPDTLIVRVWQQHPRYSGLADSSLRTVLDECEKLLLLTRADKAAARSRFAGAGLLFIPNELMPVVQQPAGNAENTVDVAQNPIYSNLVEAMVTPIRDESHPSGVVPVTIFGPGEYGDKIKFLTFDRPQAARAQQQREESITRIATAIDLPPEILTGKADLNHWTAWQIHEETFQSHLQPMVELICDSLTVGYLQPALRKAGVSEWDKYVVWYDDSELVVRPNKGETALQLYTENIISEVALRRETGFSEEDAMPEEEYRKRIGVLLQDEKLALTGEPGDAPPGSAPPAAGGGPGVNGPVGGDSPTLKDKMTPPKTDMPAGMKAATQGTPDTARPGFGKAPAEKKAVTAAGNRPRRRRSTGQQLAQLDVELMTQLRTAASEVLVRELDRAGARIRSRASNKPHRDLLADVPNHLVASVLGPAVVASLNLTDETVMRGAFESFGQRASALIAASQAARNRLVLRYLNERYDAAQWNEPPPDATDEDRSLAAISWNQPPPSDLDQIYGDRDRSNRDAAVALLLGGLMALGLSKLYDPAPDAPEPGQLGEFDGLLVPASLIRQTVTTAGGSLAITPDDMQQPDDFGGVGTGSTTGDMFDDNGVNIIARQWVYGSAIRTPFESHEALDGQEFSSWTDDVLAVQPGDEWLGTDFYHPGDHRGCLCAVAPILQGEE